MSNWLEDNFIVDIVGGSEEDAQKLKDALIKKLVDSTEEDESYEGQIN